MSRVKFPVFGLLLALMFGAIWAATPHSSSRVFAATVARPTPGQLSIVGKGGKTVGICPLRHTDVQADVAGYVARVTVTQQFSNPTNGPIEAVYTFPLPADAAVDDMTMTLGARVIKGEIKRREEARAIYEAAKSAGQAAALLDQERPNVFTQAVANILPGENVTVTISYVNLLKYDGGKYEFVFPMVVGPRFTGSGVVKDAGKITPPITPEGTRAGHDLSLRVTLDAGLPLGEVQSVLHDVDVQRAGDTRAIVRLRDEATIPNKDFVLRFAAAGSELQSGVLTYAPSPRSGGYFTLILQPPAAPSRSQISPKEMVFVIDQTGSQAGLPIAKAKETMRRCIQNLNPGDTFQLLGFNTDVFPCFPAPVSATPETVQTALDYLKPLEGNGGTDILKAADYALKIPTDPDRLRIICFLTDGYVGNDMQILDYVGKHRGEARMFPIGVGNSVNRFLIDGMAREGRGAADYVTLDEKGDATAIRFTKRVADPILLDVSVDWRGLPVADVFPRHIPDVFSSGPIVLKGRYARAGEGDIVVHGLLRGRPWTQTVHVVFPAAKADGSAMATLWAREKIEDLQNEDWMGAQTGSAKPDIKEQIVNTALEYRLMSQWTSFVAVEPRVINVGGQQKRIDVPVEMPEGVAYDGIFGAKDENATFFEKRSLGRPSLGLQLRGASGFGGMAAGAPPAPIARAKSAPMGLPSLNATLTESDSLAAQDNGTRDIADGSAAGRKRLDALKPADRQKLLREVKLDKSLRGKTGAERVTVQIWLNALPKNGLARLKAAGLTVDATLTPNKLLLGTVRADKMDALLALDFVRRIEPPKLH